MKDVSFFSFIIMISLCAWGCIDDTQESDVVDTESIPAVVRDNLSALVPRILSHQTDETITFAYITDLHNIAFTDTYSKENKNIQKINRIVTAINEIKKNVALSCVVLGGDYLWNTTSTSKDAAKDALSDFSQTLAEIRDLPILCLKGNHDDNSIAGIQNTLTKDE